MKLKNICVSERCFFPRSAFISCRKTVSLAQSLGYHQVEFHPTWRVWTETLLKGELSCHKNEICSFHISWREDGQYCWQGSWLGKLLYPAYNLFPPEPWGTRTLQKLAKKYRKPVVIHWQEDFGRYQPALMELHGSLRISLRQVLVALKDGEVNGVVIDTDKFFCWLKESKEKEGRALRQLFRYIQEVHFRFGHRDNLDLFSGKISSDSTKLMRRLVRMGYRKRVVVELGWPDEGSVEILKIEGLNKAHQGIVSFLKIL